MAGRIRRGTLSVGGAKAGLVNVDWQDAHEFDRTQADDEFSGDPIEMKRAGSGTIELLVGSIATGYASADVVVTYTEVTYTGSGESTSSKTATFTKVTFNMGGNVPSEGRGSIKISFDYATCTLA